MLELKEHLPSGETHQFCLTSVEIGDKISFELTSKTYQGLNLNFTFEYFRQKITPGYSVDVHLFKNIHFSQKDIIDFRLNELSANTGRVGYFFRLDALFEKDVLQINKHIYPYAYYAIEFIFSERTNLQIKDVELNSSDYKITDFFDDDTILLVICNQYSSELAAFSIDDYLPPLYLNGFIKFDKLTTIKEFNNTIFVKNNYENIETIKRTDGCYVLRVSIPDLLLIKESFIQHLFLYLLQQKNEPITRFIMLYQIVEICISKILHLKVQSEICGKLSSLTSIQLKKFLGEIQTEKKRINYTFYEFSRPTQFLENTIKETIISFFVHVHDADYNDAIENSKLNLVDVFYDYRNKLVHNYRLIHSPGIDKSITELKMEEINSLTEILVTQIISSFRT